MTPPGMGVVLRDRLLYENLQGIPGAAAQIGQQLAIIKEVFTQDLREAKDKMPMGNLLEDIHT